MAMTWCLDRITIQSGYGINTGVMVRVLEGHSCFALSVTFSSDGTQVHTVRVRNVATASVKQVLTQRILPSKLGCRFEHIVTLDYTEYNLS